MIVLAEVYGRISSCRSDNGLATAIVTPTTTLYGSFDLVDDNGRPMWRGLYADADGFYRNERVPAEIWASACQLMDEWRAESKKRESDARDRSHEIAGQVQSSVAEWLNANMDNPLSVN